MSRRVIELDAADLVTCFGQLYDRARNHADPEDAYTEVLGGYVYGFSCIGKAVVEDKLPNTIPSLDSARSRRSKARRSRSGSPRA